MAHLRTQPFIYVTWLKNYLIGDSLCRWSIWHRIHYQYEKAKSNFDSIGYQIKHTALLNQIQKRYASKGYEVIPELEVTVRGKVAVLKGRIDLIALREDSNLIIEVKTGTPRPSDKIQLMLYIWALPKSSNQRFRGATFDGLLVYENHEIEISALEIDEDFLKHFSHFTADIMSSEPDRKYPSPRECKWCSIADCDEKLNEETESEKENDDPPAYIPDFF